MSRHGLEPPDQAIIGSLETGTLALATAIERKHCGGAPRQRPTACSCIMKCAWLTRCTALQDSDRLTAKTRLKPKSP